MLTRLSARVDAAAAASLPLRSFELEAQHELAFRTLQSGLNVGKVVVRVAQRRDASDECHLVTGGTGGLGLLTGRWLGQRGACCLVLASRGGALARGTAEEWGAVRASDAATSLERCDTGEATHARRLMALAPAFSGVWHAAGVLSDAVLPQQMSAALARVYAPKAHCAWCLHGACSE